VWPHSIVIGVGDTAISVASDDGDFVASLEPWRVGLDVDVVDFVVELAPARAEASRGLRYLPRLLHGTCPLFRLPDPVDVVAATRRVLASYGPTGSPRLLRIALMPVVGPDGRALLVPPGHAGALAQRWYASRGLRPLYTVGCVLDVDEWRVTVDPGLGSDGAQEWFPVLDWWLPSMDPEAGLTPGQAVAHVMRLTRLDAPADADGVLHRVARAVLARMPGLAPLEPEFVIERFDPPEAARRRAALQDAISGRW
jgi:hypothetical protein